VASKIKRANHLDDSKKERESGPGPGGREKKAVGDKILGKGKEKEIR